MKITLEKLETMKGKELINVADELGVKVKCDKARTKLVEKKSDLIDRIMEVIAEEILPDPEEIVEPIEEKKQLKKPNLKIKEITYNGKTQTIREWADELGMPWPTLYDRINRNGWTVEEAIETPLGQRRKK